MRKSGTAILSRDRLGDGASYASLELEDHGWSVAEYSGSVYLSSGASLMYMEGLGSCRSLLAVKSFWQHYAPSAEVFRLLELFRTMVNESIRIGSTNEELTEPVFDTVNN
jgi:hypothetical protein